MPNIRFCCCSLIFMCSILSSTPHAVSNVDSDVSNALPKQLHTNIPAFNRRQDDQSAYLEYEFIAMHSLVKRDANNSVDVSMKNELPRPDQRSLALVFDATETLDSDNLQQLRRGAEKIFDQFSSPDESPIYNYIFVPFHEENGTNEIGPTLVTDDGDKLLSTLDSVQLHGGNGCQRSMLSSLIESLNYTLPKSYVYALSDASASDFHLESQLVEAIQRKQATISFLLSDYCDKKDNENYRVYERITQISNGQIYDIKSKTIENILNDVSTKLNNHHVLITTSYKFGKNLTDAWIFTVDETISKIHVMIAGEEPKIWIFDSNKINVGNETLALENAIGHTIENPTAGIWKIECVSLGSHSVRITAESTLRFSYGFSAPLQPVSSLSGTSYAPLNGTSNILSIESSEKVNLTEVHFLPQGWNADNFEPMKLSLVEKPQTTNETKYLFQTGIFDLPNEFTFKILVIGYSDKGNQLRRIISTSLQALNGPPPEIFLNETDVIVDEGDPLLIECMLSNPSVPSKIWIEHEHQQLTNQLEKTVSYEIEAAVPEHGGQYSCNATSIYGDSSQIINVKIIEIEVHIPEAQFIGIESQAEIEIPCIVWPDSKSSLQTKWSTYYEDNKNEIDPNLPGSTYKVSGNNLVIFELSKSDAGNYTCEVEAASGIKSASTQLIVQYAPEQDSNEMKITMNQYGEPVIIDCTADAEPPAQTKWKKPSAKEFEFLGNPLVIEKLSFSDEGLYECILDNGIGVANRMFRVIGQANKPPNITKPSVKQLNVAEGDDIELVCHCEMCSDGTIQLGWKHKNNIGIEYNPIDQFISSNINDSNVIDYSLNIKNATADKSGIYDCTISNSFGSDVYSIEVNVKPSPNVEVDSETGSYVHKCVSNQLVNFVELETDSSKSTHPTNVYDCNASDVNRADISLLLLDVQSREKIHTIMINANHSNQPTSKCSLNALQTPDLTQIISDKGATADDLQSKLSNSDVFECTFNATSPFDAKHLLVVFVTPNSISANDSEFIHVKSKQESILKCSIAVSSPKWSEQPYTCESFNSVAAISNPFYFLVQDPPKILSNFDESIRLVRGERSSIACTASGSPDDFHLYWVDDQQSTISNDSVLNVDTKNTQFKEKNFTCVSENAFGKDDATVVVEIIDRPELSTDAIDLTEVNHINLGDGFDLKCPFKHFNRCDWLKNGELFNNNRTSIDFEHVAVSDTGNYTCRCSNEAGANEYTYQLLVHYSPVTQDPSINDGIFDVILAKNFSYECQATGYPPPSFEWTHDGEVISSNAHLFIEKLDTSNSGEYVCTATNENGASRIAINLNVLYAPTPATDDTDRIVEAVQNHSTVLNCSVDANPMPTYEWYKNKVKITGFDASFIEIQNANLDDNGLYECVVKNSVSSSIIPFTLNVFAGASIQSVSENKTFDESDGNMRLTCNAIGNPLPVLKWSYNNRVLISSSKSNSSLPFALDNRNDLIEERFDVSQDNIDGVIRYMHPHSVEIELHLNAWPTGVHRFDCLASNAYGSDERNTFIEHVLKPTFPHQNDTLIDASDGIPVALNCNDVNGYPVPEITWQKNGIDIDFSVQKYQLANDNKTLRISSVTTDDDDDKSYYACVAANSVGAAKNIFKLNVLTPPRLKSSDGNDKFESTVVTRKGAPVLLECPVDANPKPEIKWTKNGGNSEKVVATGQTSALRLDDLFDSTVFICYANNSMGSFNYTFRILVERAPEIQSSAASNEQNFNVGDSFTLKCDIDALPEPQLNWYKNRNPIASNVSKNRQNFHGTPPLLSADRKHLQISNSTADDFGEYICVAENYLGKTEQTFDVAFHPYWGKWSEWGECSEICGKGIKERHRICHQMESHRYRGRNQSTCVGDDREVKQCMNEPCRWSDWSECSRTCGEGQKYRYKGKMLEIVPCIRSVCIEKIKHDKLQYTPLITYESSRDTNKILQKLNHNQNQRAKPFRSKTTKTANHSRSVRSTVVNV